jgi:hypothetical protein
MAVCAYQNGDKSALERAESALHELENADEQKYEKDVWMSGGYMKIAEAIYPDDAGRAKEYLSKAKQIIDENPDLKLRKLQLEKLEPKFE